MVLKVIESVGFILGQTTEHIRTNRYFVSVNRLSLRFFMFKNILQLLLKSALNPTHKPLPLPNIIKNKISYIRHKNLIFKPMHHPKDEQSLAASLKAGSVKAFEAIYRLYVDRLYAYCFDAIRMKQETEEVVHDVFLALWESRDNIEPDKGVGRLLFTIARKRRIDAFRKLVNSPIYEDYIEHQNSLPSPEHPPMEYEEFDRIFRKTLCTMPARMRTMIIWSKLQGLSNGEIALRLGVAEKTVRNQLSLALKELHYRLSPYIDNNRRIPPDT